MASDARMRFQLIGSRKAVVDGSPGIGHETVRLAAAQGAEVHACRRDAERRHRAGEELGDVASRAHRHGVDGGHPLP